MFEAFAGIGSQYQALKNIAPKYNYKIKPVGMIEWFVPAIIGYIAIHYPHIKIKKESFEANISISNDSKKPINVNELQKILKKTLIAGYLKASKDICNNLFDINTVKGKDIDNDIDIFTYSFPCQDISNQGKQKGFAKNTKTRSGLLWELERIFNEMKTNKQSLPKYLIMENVKDIINNKHIKNFHQWLECLNQLGYNSKYYCLNAAHFNSCQNRVRVFCISVLKTHQTKTNFTFPTFNMSTNKIVPLSSILTNNHNWNQKYNKYQLSEFKLTKSNIKKATLVGFSNFASENGIYDVNYMGPTLTASGAMSRLKLYFGKNKIREILPEECFLYMGFKNKDYLNVVNTKLVNNTKMIYLCGNSISVQVLEAIFKELKF